MSRVQLLARLLEHLEARYTQLRDPPALLRDYRAMSYTLGQRVRVATARGVLEGQAIDIAADGALVVQSADTTHHIGAGDVELIGFLGGSR